MNVGQKVRITNGPDKGKKGAITGIIPIRISPVTTIKESVDMPDTAVAVNWFKVELEDGTVKSFDLDEIELIDE